MQNILVLVGACDSKESSNRKESLWWYIMHYSSTLQYVITGRHKSWEKPPDFKRQNILHPGELLLKRSDSTRFTRTI